MCVCVWVVQSHLALSNSFILFCPGSARGQGTVGGLGKGCRVVWWVLWPPSRRADDRPNKASQGLGPSLSALPPRCPPWSSLPPWPATPTGRHMWSDPNGTQLDSHLSLSYGSEPLFSPLFSSLPFKPRWPSFSLYPLPQNQVFFPCTLSLNHCLWFLSFRFLHSNPFLICLMTSIEEAIYMTHLIPN